MLNNNTDWQESSLHTFWGEIAPCDHVVQVYENTTVFLDSLIGYIWSGFIAGDSVVIITTAEHRAQIEYRLKNRGFNLTALTLADRYIAFDAKQTLAKLIVNGHPDEELFLKTVQPVLEQAQSNHRKVRVFGEMVAILWAQGLEDAAIELEELWNKLQKIHDFTLFCSYPKSAFTEDVEGSIQRICSTHHKIIEGNPGYTTEVLYKTTSI